MREILFKAKRIYNGEWVEGYLLRDDCTGQCFIHASGNSVNESDKVNEEGCLRFVAFEVDESTICQYTGLTAYWGDDEEASVWEHDLVEVDYRGKMVIAEVKYECGMFLLASDEFVDSYIPLFDVVILEDKGWVDAKVIGNVFDNPESLEVNHELTR